VLNHISRYNYGIIYAESYVEGKHPVKHKTQDKDYPGTYQVFLMEWYLNKVIARFKDPIHKEFE
jgi:hypothetical protein